MSRPRLRYRITALSIIPAQISGAVLVYAFFTYIDPLAGARPDSLESLTTFVAVTVSLVLGTLYVVARSLGSLGIWRQRLADGLAPTEIPDHVKRRVLNAPLTNALLSQGAWTIAGLFYFPYLAWWLGVGVPEAGRATVTIVFLFGPIVSALAFLASEFNWRRQVPFFFPDGHLVRTGVTRVPILVASGACRRAAQRVLRARRTSL